MGGAATFLASPWGGGSDAAATRPSASCAATTAHSRGAWRPWITLEAWRRTGVGWACLPRARRQGKSQKVKPVLPSSHRRPFWAAHPSAPGGSFAFGMMKCHARCTLPGRPSVRVTGQASDQVARCSSSSLLFLIVSTMRIYRVLHVWPHRKVFRVAPSHRLSRVSVCAGVCARQSPLTCAEASFPGLHGTVIAKFKQWPRGTAPPPHTRRQGRADGAAAEGREIKVLLILRLASERCPRAERSRRARQDEAIKTGHDGPERVAQGGGLMNTRSMYPFAGPTSQLEASRI